MELFAYLDPGSASALLAAVLAGVAGAGAALRHYWSKIKDKLFFWRKSEPVTDGAASGSAPAPASEPSEDEPAEK